MIEKYPCNDLNEARARERYWYEILTPNLNMCNPCRSQKEYKEVKERDEFLAHEITDLTESVTKLESLIQDLTNVTEVFSFSEKVPTMSEIFITLVKGKSNE